jgi:hypothetical protein
LVPADAAELVGVEAPATDPATPDGSAARHAALRALHVAHDGLPCLIGVPVLAGIAVTLWRLSSMRYPHLGWAQTIANDAKAVSFGDWIYGDPSSQYTGMLYTPLYPAVLAPLYRLLWWDGWPIAVTTLAGITTASMIGVIAASGVPRSASWHERAVPIAGGFGLGGTAWWIVSTDYRNLLYDGRADQLAWCLAILGLCSLAFGVSRNHVRVWPTALLLSAALWTKQTSVGALLAASTLMTWWLVRGAVSRRTWLRFVLSIGAINVVALGLLQLVSRGWAVYFLLTMPGRHFRDPAVFVYVKELRNLIVLPMVGVVIAAAGLVLTRPRRDLTSSIASWSRSVAKDARSCLRRVEARERRVPTLTVALLALVLLFLLFSFPPAFTGRRKQGGEANQYIGMLWGLGLLLALVHRTARRTPRSMVTGIAAYALLIGAVHVDAIRSFAEERSVALPTTYPAATFVSISPELRDYARHHLVYLPYDADLSSQFSRRTWPMQQNIVDLLAAGEQPLYLVEALIDREFDAVWPFDPAADPYASAYGQREENYLWKLNYIIDQGYVLDPEVGLLVRRELADTEWLRSCFGPFNIDGVDWQIRRGGGLWCQDSPSSLTMRGTPAPITEIATTTEVAFHGTVTGELPRGIGAFEIAAVTVSGESSIRVAARPDGRFDVVTVDTQGHRTSSSIEGDTDGRVVVHIGQGGSQGAVRLMPLEPNGELILRTTADGPTRISFEEE